MKTFSVFFLAFFFSVTVALAQDTLYVYQAGAVLYKRVITAVDSVTFQKVYAAPTTVTDKDGNVYRTVTIGTQTWMAENLKTTKYRNGDVIPSPAGSWSALTSGAQAAYENSAANATKYGLLYNWYAVNDSRKIAPVGWHVATDAEWTTLTNYVSANLGTSLSVAKALAATTDWITDSGTGTVGNNLTLNNATGFSALPGGYRFGDGTFDYLSSYDGWWSSTEYNTSYAWYRYMYYDSSLVGRISDSKANGFSVRCVRD